MTIGIRRKAVDSMSPELSNEIQHAQIIKSASIKETKIEISFFMFV